MLETLKITISCEFRYVIVNPYPSNFCINPLKFAAGSGLGKDKG